MIRRREYKNSGNYDLTIRATNTTNSVIQMNILGNPTYTNDIANQFIQYQWDITSFAFSIETTIYLQYRKVGASTYQLAVVALPSQDTQGIVDALNSLNLASFYSYTSGGSTFVTTYNDTYEFGVLNIYYPSIIDPTFLYGNGFNFASGTSALAIQSDGKILIGGSFTSYNSFTSIRIARLNSDGSFDTTFITGTGFDGVVTQIAVQTDGKIIVGGSFTNYNGTPANCIIRLNSDGSIDPTFVYGTGFTIGGTPTIDAIIIQPDGKILIGGAFSAYNGVFQLCIVRLNINGSIDGTFINPTGATSNVYAIQLQSDNKIILGGLFPNYNGTVTSGIIRLNTNGTYDPTFVFGTAFNAGVLGMAIQSDDKIICVGAFSAYNGTSSPKIVRLNPNGNIDLSFNVGFSFDSFPQNIIITNDNKYIVVGAFNSYDGNSSNYIARLNNDGSYDTTWNIGTGFDANTINIKIQNNQNVTVTGNYNLFDGVGANNIIRLLPS